MLPTSYILVLAFFLFLPVSLFLLVLSSCLRVRTIYYNCPDHFSLDFLDFHWLLGLLCAVGETPALDCGDVRQGRRVLDAAEEGVGEGRFGVRQQRHVQGGAMQGRTRLLPGQNTDPLHYFLLYNHNRSNQLCFSFFHEF